MELLFWVSLIAIFYAYGGYALLLTVLIRVFGIRRETYRDLSYAPSVTIIITCHNEEAVIREKLENTLSLDFHGATLEQTCEILVASDASTDSTNAIVESFASRGVRLIALTERNGKEAAQLEAVKQSSGEVLIFTDAKTRLSPTAIQILASYFADEDVGAVSSRDIVESESGQSGEGIYVAYEMWLRSLESEFHSLIGLSGSCFAVRAKVAQQMSVDIPSDFSQVLQARALGMCGVHAPDAVCYYRAVPSEKREFDRKVRTVLRGITTLFKRKEVLNPMRYGLFSFSVISHKLMRWLAPIFMVAAGISCLVCAMASTFYMVMLGSGGAFILLAVIGLLAPFSKRFRVIRIPLFFIVTNAAILVAWVRFVKGERLVRWSPSAR